MVNLGNFSLVYCSSTTAPHQPCDYVVRPYSFPVIAVCLFSGRKGQLELWWLKQLLSLIDSCLFNYTFWAVWVMWNLRVGWIVKNVEGGDYGLFIYFPGTTYSYENQESSGMANLRNKTLNPRPHAVEALDCEFGASLSPLPPFSSTKV